MNWLVHFGLWCRIGREKESAKKETYTDDKMKRNEQEVCECETIFKDRKEKTGKRKKHRREIWNRLYLCGYRRNHFEMIEKTTPQLVLYKKIMKIC